MGFRGRLVRGATVLLSLGSGMLAPTGTHCRSHRSHPTTGRGGRRYRTLRDGQDQSRRGPGQPFRQAEPKGANTGCGPRYSEEEWDEFVAEFRSGIFSGYRYLKGGWPCRHQGLLTQLHLHSSNGSAWPPPKGFHSGARLSSCAPCTRASTSSALTSGRCPVDLSSSSVQPEIPNHRRAKSLRSSSGPAATSEEPPQT